MLVPATRWRMFDRIKLLCGGLSGRFDQLLYRLLEPPRIVVAEIAPNVLVISVLPIGLSIVPSITRFGPLGWSFVIVTRVGSTCRTIANFASAPALPDESSVTFGFFVVLTTSMSSMTSARAEWLMIVTVCQSSRKLNVPQKWSLGEVTWLPPSIVPLWAWR